MAKTAGKWTQQQKDLQKWNYKIYRDAGYTPKEARKLRNRTPEFTINDILDRNRVRRESFKKPFKVSKIPVSVVPAVRKRMKTRSKDLQTLFDISPSKARKYDNMNPEAAIMLNRRMRGFYQTIKDVTGKGPAQVLTEIKRGMGKSFSMRAFFKALRTWYEKKVGVRPEPSAEPLGKVERKHGGKVGRKPKREKIPF